MNIHINRFPCYQCPKIPGLFQDAQPIFTGHSRKVDRKCKVQGQTALKTTANVNKGVVMHGKPNEAKTTLLHSIINNNNNNNNTTFI